MGDTDVYEATPEPKARIMFVHVTTKVEFCIVTEKK